MILNLIKLYWPLVPCFFSVYLFFRLGSIFNQSGYILIDIDKIVPIFSCGRKLKISNKPFVRCVLAILVAFFVLKVLCINVKVFFPEHFDMEVFFDDQGVSDSLGCFSSEELKELGVASDYEYYRNSYYEDINGLCYSLYGKKFPSDEVLLDKHIHSAGHTSFKFRKTGIFQKYHITESKGEITHFVEKPGQPKREVKSYFEKLNTRHDYLNPSVIDIVQKGCFVIQPRFKQIFSINLKSDGVSYHHSLVGATKVYIHPYPHVSNTVYFIEYENIGLIPVGYAIYQ